MSCIVDFEKLFTKEVAEYYDSHVSGGELINKSATLDFFPIKALLPVTEGDITTNTIKLNLQDPSENLDDTKIKDVFPYVFGLESMCKSVFVTEKHTVGYLRDGNKHEYYNLPGTQSTESIQISGISIEMNRQKHTI
jgi:hypothetical protein